MGFTFFTPGLWTGEKTLQQTTRALQIGTRHEVFQHSEATEQSQVLKCSGHALLRDLAARGAITLIDPWERLCDPLACGVMLQGAPVYFDTNHLTNRGALLLRDLLMPALAGGDG